MVDDLDSLFFAVEIKTNPFIISINLTVIFIFTWFLFHLLDLTIIIRNG